MFVQCDDLYNRYAPSSYFASYIFASSCIICGNMELNGVQGGRCENNVCLYYSLHIEHLQLRVVAVFDVLVNKFECRAERLRGRSNPYQHSIATLWTITDA